MSLVTLVAYNVGSGPDDAVSRDLAQLREIADAGVLNEVSDRTHLLPAPGWGLYQPNHEGNQRHNALIWNRNRFKRRRRDSTQLHKATNVGPSGAGSAVLGAGWLHHVRLRERDSGGVIHVLGLHQPPSVQGHAATPEGRELRRELFGKGVAGVVERVDRIQRGAVFVGGDWNATPDFSLLEPLARSGLMLGYTPEATHGQRAIDLWYHRDNPDVEVVEHFTIDLSSDHKASGVTYGIR